MNHYSRLLQKSNRKSSIDVSSDANNVDMIQITKNKTILQKKTKVNIRDISDGLEVDAEDEVDSESKCKNVINLHFS